jgi:hypothetical protein
MAFATATVRDIVKVAKANKIEPAALLAVVEVESAGQPFEMDGVTPRFLYERHVMYREVKKRRGEARADEAIRQNLARKTWNRSVQYKDQQNSTARLALMKRAKAFDEECACRATSWGLGQTMGFHAESQGFKSAVEFVRWMTKGGVAAQIEAMVKEIKKSGLVDEINRHDWAGFARVYNGAGYAQNQYDTRMAKAYAKWKVQLPKMKLDAPKPAPVPPPPNIEPVDPPAPKKGWFRSLGSKVKAGLAAIGFTGIGVFTDWQIAAVVAGFVLLIIIGGIILFFWVWDAKDLKAWVERQFR